MLNVEDLMQLMKSRITVLPKRLVNPAPSNEQKENILMAAATAPDHRQILPWRFIEISDQSRNQLAQIFEEDLLNRDVGCTPDQKEKAREKAYRSPWLVACICRETDDEPHVNPHERYISLGCAIQNMLLAATSLGFSSSLTTGQAMRSTPMASFLKLEHGEAVACFVSIGKAGSTPKVKTRPEPHQYFSTV